MFGGVTRRTTLGLLGTSSLSIFAQTRASRAQSGASRSGKPIDSSYFVSIGGLEQWISIRGEDMRNPALLVVHGGPGEAQWPVAEHYRDWERHFTVVQWDQRGAGHTFGRYGVETPDMTLDRISRDGVELSDHICRVLGKKKIIVLGHSWGSNVGVTMIQRAPSLVAAYVGTGQVGSWKGALTAKFNLALAEARSRGDVALVKDLETSGPPDLNDAEKVFAFNDRVYRFWPPSDQEWVKSLRANGSVLRKSDPQNYKDFEDGFRFTARRVIPDQIKTDLPSTASEIETAFFVIQGRDDIITPTKDATEYFQRVKAPHKQLILIPNAGHFAFMTARSEFLNHLVQAVRPIAIARGA
jgi:pimeloyl-ACP methyl ester carboxylesterase